jgi:hypothetical protein
MISKHKIVIFYAVLTPTTETLILDKEFSTLPSQFIGWAGKEYGTILHGYC